MNLEKILKFLIQNKFAIIFGLIGVIITATPLVRLVIIALCVGLFIVCGIYVDKNFDKIKSAFNNVMNGTEEKEEEK